MEKEVELLERVLLRFAMAEEGEQLEKAVSTFLVLTIDKLASPHEATRNKVQICHLIQIPNANFINSLHSGLVSVDSHQQEGEGPTICETAAGWSVRAIPLLRDSPDCEEHKHHLFGNGL